MGQSFLSNRSPRVQIRGIALLHFVTFVLSWHVIVINHKKRHFFSFCTEFTDICRCMPSTDYTFKPYCKIQDLFTSNASKCMPPCQYWLTASRSFHHNSIFFAHRYPLWKPMKTVLHFSQLQKKPLLIWHFKTSNAFTFLQRETCITYHSRITGITGYLRSHDPTKQYYCLLQHN